MSANATLGAIQTLKGKVGGGSLTGRVAIAPTLPSGDPYDGEYDITPTVEGQTMPTRGKLMEDNVTIFPIPFYEVSNNSGGNTVYIAKEV